MGERGEGTEKFGTNFSISTSGTGLTNRRLAFKCRRKVIKEDPTLYSAGKYVFYSKVYLNITRGTWRAL